MVFSGFTFLIVFLPVFLLAYLCVPDRFINARNLILLIFSLFFYAFGEPKWVLILIFSGLWDYFIGLRITKCRASWKAKFLLALSLCGNLGLLLVFKYGSFFLGLVGIDVVFALTLPIGISFYTFQTMSYTIDLYKGQVKPQRDFIAFMTYISMFPQLVAGPIVRYSDISGKLSKRTVSLTGFSDGVTRFSYGLAKKVLFANHAGRIAAELLSSNPENTSVTGVWLGMVLFMFQIYFDFSGYSDMAIGLGKMIGFDFRENFDHPYTSKTITDFWRRWHISLGSFFRDYVYIPMGGNRRRAVFNLLFVWMLTGLWHGASVNFVLWGLYFGIVLIAEKYLLRGLLKKIPAALSHLYSLIIILYGWVIFYFTDLDKLAGFSARFWGVGKLFTDYRTTELFLSNLWILLVFAIFSTKIPARIIDRLKSAVTISEPLLNGVLLCVSMIVLVGQTFNPFLYFRF